MQLQDVIPVIGARAPKFRYDTIKFTTKNLALSLINSNALHTVTIIRHMAKYIHDLENYVFACSFVYVGLRIRPRVQVFERKPI